MNKKNKRYVIVVEGTDGSGKSFIINAITPNLHEMGYTVMYNHLRPNAIPDIAVLMGKRKKNTNKDLVVKDPHNGKQSGLLGSLLRWGYYMVDYTYGYMKKVVLGSHNNTVFIFDRYYYEYYFDPKRSHTCLPHWILRLGEILIPSPDLILCLGGDPDAIFKRKPETSLEEVTRQVHTLQAFCRKRKRAVWVDTTLAPEESILQANNAIMGILKTN